MTTAKICLEQVMGEALVIDLSFSSANLGALPPPQRVPFYAPVLQDCRD